MKLLLCINSLQDISPVIEQLSLDCRQDKELPYLYSTKAAHHEVDIVTSGVGVYQTTYKMTKALTQQRYHLALKLSLTNAYSEAHKVGNILNIINEKPGDYGMEVNGEWKDHYDYNLLKPEDPPHVRGGFINLTNAYMNIFSGFKKAVGVTVNHYADTKTYLLRKDKYKADCETGDGLGFAYPCLFEKQTFYHLAFVERNMSTGESDFAKATEVMNETLIDLLKLL